MQTRALHEAQQVLTFHIGGDTYAIDILRVREIVEYQTVTRVPTAPAWIRGVVNLRGSVVPALDLAVKLGLPGAPVGRRTCIVLVEVELQGEETVLGIIADAVDQVVDLSPADVQPPPSFGARVHPDYLLGLAKLDSRLALLLDIDRILTTDELLRVEDLSPVSPHSPLSTDTAAEAG
jgi:purine-binding chemotaxis protein CheW